MFMALTVVLALITDDGSNASLAKSDGRVLHP
jgi:hypothetical protein